MLQIDGILGATFLRIDCIVRAVVEYHAVLQDLAHAGTLVIVGRLENLHGAWGIGGNGAGKEVTSRSEAQLGGTERILNRSVWRGLADEAARAGGTILSLRQTIDSVVEQNHVQVDVAAIGMYEVIASDSQSVAVTADLPNGEGRICHLATSGNRSGTAVNCVHAIRRHIVRQTAGTTDTADDSSLRRRHTYLCHRFMQAGEEEVVTTSRTPTRLSFLEIITRICHSYVSFLLFNYLIECFY